MFHLDINNAFLYDVLSEDVYMTLLAGYSFDKYDNKASKLVKSLSNRLLENEMKN